MNDFIPYIVFGIISGSIYGLSAMGLVLTYRTSGVFNIAHGGVCATAAFAFYSLHQVHGVPWPLAAAVVLVGFGAIAGLCFERMAWLMAETTTTFKIVGTVGLFVAIQGAVTLVYGDIALVFDPFLPQGEAFRLPGVGVSVENVIILAIGAGAAIGLAVFFRVTRLGIQMRAVVDDPQLLDMTGAAPTKVRRSAWMIGMTFAAASGVLFASNQAQVDVNVLSLLVVQAFGAATIARFQSLPMCLVGGIIVGILQKLIAKEINSTPDLQGLDLSVPFIVLFIGLLVIPRNRLAEVGRHIRARRPAPRRTPRPVSFALVLVGGVLVLALPNLVGSHLAAWNVAVAQIPLFVSLHLLVRTSGQISLCHVGFAAIGAAGFGHSLRNGVPFVPAVLIGGLICVPAALVICIPAIRLSGLYLALATLGFGIFLSSFAYGKDFMFGAGQLLTRRPEVWGLDEDERFYYVLVGVAVVCVGTVVLIERSRLGSLLRAMSDSPVALSTLGLSVNVTRVLVFCISGFIAGIGGGMFAALFRSVGPSSFNYTTSLVALAVMAIAGTRTVTAAILAPVLLYVPANYISNPDAGKVLQIAFGVAALVAAFVASGRPAQVLASRAALHSERRVGPATARAADWTTRRRNRGGPQPQAMSSA
jgi:branched-subunit amino acid ABC-type transport system permease component